MAFRMFGVVLGGPVLLWVLLASMTPGHALLASSDSADVVLGNSPAHGAAVAEPTAAVRSVGDGVPLDRKEVVDDPYQPGRATAPAARRRGRTTWTLGPYTSVQVNVDPYAYNIPGDAANEPSIAVDPTNPGRMAIGWRQFDTVESNFRQAGWSYSHDGGHHWTFPGVLRPGEFSSDPVLDADLAGNFYYYSLQPNRGTADWSCYLYKSFDGGVTWPQDVYARGGDKEWMLVDRTSGAGSGNLYFAWNVAYSCCGNTDFARSTNGGATVPPVQKLPTDLRWGTMSVGPDGELYVAGEGFYVAKSTNAQFAAETPEFDFVTYVNLGGSIRFGAGPNPGGLLGQTWVATDHSAGPNRGNVYLLCSVDPPGGDPLDVHFSRSADGGLTWSSPVRVNDDSQYNGAWQWFGTMSVAPNGRIDVIWNDTRADSSDTYSELYYSYSDNAGVTWSANVPLSIPFDPSQGYPSQNKLGDYYDMVSDDLGANLAYAATFNGEHDVYFLRIGSFDCNGNQVDDQTDIAQGTSEDCDANGVPDECEPDADCNDNGIQDICDIAGPTSIDCQPNRVPDECELANNDCNGNGTPDECDIADETSLDCQPDLIPDECQLTDNECNANGIPDDCDIVAGTSDDCQPNGFPDECELANNDCNTNDVPDDCDIALRVSADCNTNGIPDDCDLRDAVSADCNSNGWPDECDVELCGPLWNGFSEFPIYAVVHEIDSDSDGSAWNNPLFNATVQPYGCEEGGWLDHVVQVMAPSADPESAYVTSEYFQTDDGALPPDGSGYALSFSARIDMSIESCYDWEFFVYDAESGAAVVQLEFASTASLAVPYPGHILVNTNTVGGPVYADTGVALVLGYCHDEIQIVLDNRADEAEAVKVYIGGALKVITKRLEANARRMDYFHLEPVDNLASAGTTTYFIVDAFDLCANGTSVPPSVYDCNDNGQLDECDIAQGLAMDCDGDGIPDGPDGCGLFGDFDDDGSVDLSDYADFRECITGPDGGLGVECQWGDIDCDDDIDLRDFAAFQHAFDGP